MKLSISNFAKIDKADITIDGITVIAGENNTGKSTIGKILFQYLILCKILMRSFISKDFKMQWY